MAVTTAALSGNIKDLGLEIPDNYLPRVVLVVEANTTGSLLRDTAGNTLLAGAKRIAVDKTTGEFSQTLVTTNSADIMPAADRLYRATLIYPSGKPGEKNQTVTSGWFPFTAAASLADVWLGIEVTAVSTAVYQSISQSVDLAAASATTASASATSSAASASLARTLVTSDLGTTDGQTRALIEDPNSQTSGALTATIAAEATLKPTTDLGDWALLRRDTSDVSKGVAWTTPHEVIARALGWAIVTDTQFAGGADPTGVADSTAAIQAAIAHVAAGGTVWLGIGTYKITAAININANSIAFRGANRRGSVIKQYTANAKILNVTGVDVHVSDLELGYGVTPTSGGTALYSTQGNCHYTRLRISSCHIGMDFPSGSGQTVSDFQIYNYESIGIYVHGVNDVFFSDFILNAGNATRGALGGIRLAEFAEAILFHNGDVIYGVYSLTTGATTNAVGQRPAYNNFTNVFFDSAAQGCLIDKMVETEFIGCWFSGGRSGSGFPGLSISNSDSLTFTNTRFFNNGGNGCQVNATALRTVFLGCKFESNSVTAGAGVTHGLVFAAGTTDFVVSGCIAHNGLFSGTQGRGILVNSGASDRYVITNNLVSGNVTAGVTDSGTGVNKTVSGNW